MSREVEARSGERAFVNGRPAEVVRCEDCGKPVHPSLECVCNGE